jgi:hypothetical protein
VPAGVRLARSGYGGRQVTPRQKAALLFIICVFAALHVSHAVEIAALRRTCVQVMDE